ncbi:MAG: hypothetical protein IPN47_23500 [Gemmatimonadetes bacterium]|nr:hypothetical protein [Gemmatimonadota bacterium]
MAILIGGKLSDVARVQLVLLQGLSLLKWCALAAAAVIAFVLWRTPDGVSLDSFRQFLRTLRTGKAQHPVAAMAGILLVTALFVALVAMPAGGPLNQIPDVLRRQLEGHDGDWSALWSAAAVMQLAACSGLAAWWVTNPRHGVPRPPDTASWKIVTGVAVMALALTAVASYVDGALRVVPLATLVVALSIWGAAIVARLTGVAAVPMPTVEQRQDERRHDGLEAPDSERALWAGGVAGAVLVATGLGLVRAAFPPFVLGLRSGRVDWSVALLAGIVLALAGGFVAQLLATGAHPRLAGNDARATRRRHAIRAVVGLIAATTLAFAGVLAIHPEQAVVWGTTGVIAIGYAVAILAIGGLTWISRARAGWEATYALGVGWRTPWLTLVLLTWGVASVLNTEGIYHDARLRSELGPSTLRHRSPADAFDAWLASQRSECTAGAPGEIPMVLVAAPGGGIRAAYWTAAVLDSLFGGSTDECTLRRLFAISGVSGGSVGAATWLVARAAERSGTAAVERLAGDRALASTAAGLLLRDVYQPFTGISTAWSDRAALLEDGWVAASQPYLSSSAESGIGGRWSQLGGGLPWCRS